MLEQLLKKTAELAEQGATFAVATVVRCLPPTSGKPGDKALVYADGTLWGWIGGGCAQPVVVKEALKALADGRPRLVRISPSRNGAEEGIVDYTMTCHSGGELDVYIEPVLPKPHLVILGRSPIAQTLARLAGVIGYAASAVTQEKAAEDFGDAQLIAAKDMSLAKAGVKPQTFIVVSTQGEGDEEALEQALKTEASYIAFVASKTKAAKVLDYLKGKGIAAERLKQVRTPAGLDIHAKSPQEIAVSILAQVIQARGERKLPSTSSQLLPVISDEAKDPVCGMSVQTSKARYRSEYEGKAFYFCCAGCKESFDRAPSNYLLLK